MNYTVRSPGSWDPESKGLVDILQKKVSIDCYRVKQGELTSAFKTSSPRWVWEASRTRQTWRCRESVVVPESTTLRVISRAHLSSPPGSIREGKSNQRWAYALHSSTRRRIPALSWVGLFERRVIENCLAWGDVVLLCFNFAVSVIQIHLRWTACEEQESGMKLDWPKSAASSSVWERCLCLFLSEPSAAALEDRPRAMCEMGRVEVVEANFCERWDFVRGSRNLKSWPLSFVW